MPRMTGGQAAVEALVAEGVRTVFGIPGIHGLALFDALHDATGIRRITTRHEQSAAYMADGYARASGEVGVCLTSTGPGAINSLAAMGTAYADSIPVLNIFTQAPSTSIGRERGYLHEVRDQITMFSQVTGWTAGARNVTAIPALVHEAMDRMRTGRARPAAIEMPKDVLDATGDVTFLRPGQPVRQSGDATQVAAVANALRESRRPLIWAGGGVAAGEASSELAQLAEVLDAPVITSVMGKGAVPADHPLHLGSQGLLSPVQEYLDGCDVLLAIGTRFTEIDTAGWTLRLPETLVQIDVDPAEIGRNYPASLSVVGDAKLVLGQVLEAVGEGSTAPTGRAQDVAKVRAQVRRDLVDRSPEGVHLMDEIGSAVPSGAIFANDVCTAAYWGWMLLEVDRPREYIYPWGFGTLGAGLPLGIGAKVARPDKAVLAICGDGGFLYTAMDLATAVQFGINVVALVVNDNRFGILEPQQMDRFGRTTMTELKNPRFASMAKSFGAHGVTIDGLEEVGPALRDAFAAERPSVVELRTVLPHPFEW